MKIEMNFDSWYAFTLACQMPVKPINQQGKSDTTSFSFTGTHSWEDAQNVAMNGDALMESRVRKIGEGFASLALPGARDTSGMRPEWDVSGDEPDIDRYLTGEPENMVTYQPDERIACGRIVSIGISLCHSAIIKTSEIERRGAAIVALIDLLEQSGRRVEIHTMSAVSGGSIGRHAISVRTCVKKSENIADFTRLVYTLVHPSMLRRHSFRLWETTEIKVAGTNYGIPDHDEAARIAANYDLFIDATTTSTIGASDEAARQWIEETIKKIEERGI